MSDLIVYEGKTPALSPDTVEKLIFLEQTAKKVADEQKKLKEAIREAMEAAGIIKIDTPEVMINYIAATDRETFDSKMLRADFPDIYDTYCRISTVAPSIRIKIK